MPKKHKKKTVAKPKPSPQQVGGPPSAHTATGQQSASSSASTSGISTSSQNESKEQLRLRVAIRKNYQALEKLFRAIAFKKPELAFGDDEKFYTAIESLKNAKSSWLLEQVNYGISASSTLNKILGNYSLLGLACLRGKHNFVATLLGLGVSPNVPNANFCAPLSIAVNQGDQHLVNMLLDANADPNFIDAKGDAPLFHAIACTGSASVKNQIVKRLLQAPNIELKIISGSNETLLDLAISRGDILICYMLFQAGIDVNYPDAKGNTPLSKLLQLWLSDSAIREQLKTYSEIIKGLFKNGAKLYLSDDEETNCALLLLRCNQLEFYQSALYDSSDKKNRPYLLYHIIRCKLVTRFEVKNERGILFFPQLGVRVDVHDLTLIEKNILLMSLTIIAKTDTQLARNILQGLLKAGTDPNFAIPMRHTLSDEDAICPDKELLPSVLEIPSKIPEAATLYPVSILAYYLIFGLQELVAELLVAGSDPNVGHGARTPLRIAICLQEIDCVRLLLRHKADPTLPTHYKAEDLLKQETSPLNAAVMVGSLESVNLLLPYYDINEINRGWGEYLNPLCNAIYLGHKEIMRALISAGASLTIEIAQSGLSSSEKKMQQKALRIKSEVGTPIGIDYFPVGTHSPLWYGLTLNDPSSIFFCLQEFYKQIVKRKECSKYDTGELRKIEAELRCVLNNLYQYLFIPTSNMSQLEALGEFRKVILYEFGQDIFTLADRSPISAALYYSYIAYRYSHGSEIKQTAQNLLNVKDVEEISPTFKEIETYGSEQAYKKVHWLLNYFIKFPERTEVIQNQLKEVLTFLSILSQKHTLKEFSVRYRPWIIDIEGLDGDAFTIDDWLDHEAINPNLDEEEEKLNSNQDLPTPELSPTPTSVLNQGGVGCLPAKTEQFPSVDTQTRTVSARQYLLSRGFTAQEVQKLIKFHKEETKKARSANALRTAGKFASDSAQGPKVFSWFDGQLSSSDVCRIRRADTPCYLWLPNEYFEPEIQNIFARLVPKFGSEAGNLRILEGNELRAVKRILWINEKSFTAKLRYEFKDLTSEKRLLLYQTSNLLIALDYLENGFHTMASVRNFLASSKDAVYLDAYLPKQQAQSQCSTSQ